MQKIIKFSLLTLALLLPLHGAITVFLPDPIRHWKEGIIIILAITWLILEIKNYKQNKTPKPNTPTILAIAFLGWGTLLALTNPDPKTAIIALRYLGTGFLIFAIISRIQQLLPNKNNLKIFTKYFIIGCIISAIFGIWAKHLDGYETLTKNYSNTISSWVPGQTLPIYHAINNIPRMQGTSSGPIEFAHLMLLAILLLLPPIQQKLQILKNNKTLHITLFTILIIGLVESASRGAILGLITGLITWIILQKIKKTHIKPLFTTIGITLIGITFIIHKNENLNTFFVQRLGTTQHITRPIEALKIGIKNPITGNLGKIGPAARIKNLKQNNDDKALIAENTFIDHFAQLGTIGLILSLTFFITLFKHLPKQTWPILTAFILSINFATIFDMTPVAISFFAVLALYPHRPSFAKISEDRSLLQADTDRSR